VALSQDETLAATLISMWELASGRRLPHQLGDQRAANQAAERALALAESDRLVLPFAMTGSRELLKALRRHDTGHAALLADILDVQHLRQAPGPGPLLGGAARPGAAAAGGRRYTLTPPAQHISPESGDTCSP
jgi:hypothetical protein